MTEEDMLIRCPDGLTRRFLIVKEKGVSDIEYIVYERDYFCNKKIGKVENSESVPEVIRSYYHEGLLNSFHSCLAKDYLSLVFL
ncbi:hypothetical protein VAMP_22n155 [Candidatus Vampirococcus lugosii]|uniref:Uncharacterized protein n=2 Tax=Candidatus Vampirococcus lugosii TaxID=2789015 RepID=A0ABS5QKZ5_9BACT|nr:hypothetical protein [Candidatus Vampirococcus lugosii]